MNDLAVNTRKRTTNVPEAIAAEKAKEEFQMEAKAEMSSVSRMAKQQQVASNAVVATAPIATANKLVFSGNVVDESNGKPIQGAVVKLSGSKNVTATDANGYFALPVDSNAKDKDLVINAVGFKERPITTNTDPNAIRNAMSGDKSLNEIAIIMGATGRKREDIPAPKITLHAEQDLDKKLGVEITKPIPVSTINYNQYLERNNKLYSVNGPEQFVILSFKVKKNGRPSNIKVIKSLNSKADAEAKRLISTGPDWVLPKNGTDNVELSVRF